MFDFTQLNSDLKESPRLRTQRDKDNFNALMNSIAGTFIYNRHPLNEFKDIPYQRFKGIVTNYQLYKPLMVQYFLEEIEAANPYHRIQEKKTGIKSDKKGTCNAYRFRLALNLPALKKQAFKKINPIILDYKADIVKTTSQTIKGLTVVTDTKKPKAIKTQFEIDLFIDKYIALNITPQYVINRKGINLENCTYKNRNGKIVSIEFDGENGINTANDFLNYCINESQQAAKRILKDIIRSDFFIVASPTNGRLNTSFTALSKKLQPYLRLNSELIKGLDFANSQFLLFAHLIENSLPDSEKRLFKFLENNGFLNDSLGKEEYKSTVWQLINDLQIIVSKVKKAPDLYRFIDLAFTGKLYQNFADMAKIDKDAAKSGFFEILFGGKNDTELARLFKNTYPSVFEIIERFKVKKSHRNYKSFSVLMQKIESILIIDSLCPMLEDCRIPILTKHDSIFTMESKFNRLEKMSVKFFDTVLGENMYKMRIE